MPDTKGTILLIDDEAGIRKVVSLRLAKEGYEVLTAENGEEGLRIAEERVPDLVLLDIMLPKMKGREVCARLKANARTSNIPVIVLSALRLADHVRAGLEAGAEDYIIKPFDSAVLRERITVCLARHRNGHERGV